MLQLSASLLNRPVLSLRTGGAVAITQGIIINPNNLKIEGFYCEDADRRSLVLLYQDIREVITEGFIVNDLDVLAEPTELVRLKSLMELNFELLGKQVVTANKEKVGKVVDFSTEMSTMYVHKIYVGRSLLKNLTSGNLGIDRNQIVEITNKHIVVNDLHAKSKVPLRAAAPA